jgi:hypothetical protein
MSETRGKIDNCIGDSKRKILRVASINDWLMTSDDLKPVALSVSSAALLTISQAAIGCGIGLLLAERIDEKKRNTAAIAMLSLAFAATLLPVVNIVVDLVNGPRSKLGVRRRLRSIREGSGIQAAEEAY